MRRTATVGAVVLIALFVASLTAAAQPPEEPVDAACPPAVGAGEPPPPPPDDVMGRYADGTGCPSGFAATAGSTVRAADVLDWGEPVAVDEFEGESLAPTWTAYDGTGHQGQGRRSPDAVVVEDGVLTITGDGRGTTGGITWQAASRYGRWEARVRVPAGDASYHALLLLWPATGAFPEAGEIDFMEMQAADRATTYGVLHHGRADDQYYGELAIDGTRWNNWAVEWTPDHLSMFVNGQEWWRVDDPALLPTGEMRLCIQLDWFPGATAARGSAMKVDWVRHYAVDVPVADDREDGGEDGGGGDAEVARTEGAPDPAPLSTPPGRGLVPRPVPAR
ncbi:MAG TPA: family 16 glycosylhydrolase [Pseudonocardia sp.]|nr:family 16 glycosylhydrolase [Pseudonocardia sp.]